MKNNIYNFISKEKLDSVCNSIENAHGLPNECYLGGEYTNIERKKIRFASITVEYISGNFTIGESTTVIIIKQG